ncbi:hypothetical protein LCGC14_2247300 [marine sediment metagenome]|uniref:Uncharacterized protein n=1 Tax=marine sediment metagenome TaxID=412755 RepID=A0A0F9D3Y4_9ZZZZ
MAYEGEERRQPVNNERLLGRIDERTRNTYNLVEKQEAHLKQISGTLVEHTTAIQRLDLTVFGNGEGLVKKAEKAERRQFALSKRVWIITGILAGSGGIAGGIMARILGG